MATDVLTVSDIEQIQLAAQNRKPVRPFIQGLKRATLPAVIEYGCLRWTHPELKLPDLPAAIAESPLGLALKEVKSELGLRIGGAEGTAWDRIDPRDYGFFVLKDETQLESRPWKLFETVYNRSSAKAGFPEKVASQLSVALHEMAANASTHALPPIPVLVGFRVRDGLSLFTVADVGIGVYESLRKHPSYANTDTHAQAIRLALHDGVSSIDPGQRGFGFREVFKAILSCDGMLRFRSGKGCIEMSGADLGADRGTETFPPQLPGFQVSVCCRRSALKTA
jgi:hypothetical protein